MRKHTIFLCKMTLIMSVLIGCSSNPSIGDMDEPILPQVEKKVIVETDVIKQGDLYSQKRIPGQVMSTEESEMYANFGGRVTKLAVREGQVVEKGQVIAQLDSEEQETAVRQSNDAVDQAQISVTQAKQQLQNAENGKLQATKRHEQAMLKFKKLEEKYSESKLQDENKENTSQSLDLAELKSQWDITIKNLERSSRLYEEGMISQKELEEAQSQEKSTRRNYEKGLLAAKESTKELEDTIENEKINLLISEMELKQSDVVIEQAKTALAQAERSAQQAEEAAVKTKSKLNDSTIHAPFTGVVKKIHVNEGGYAAQHAPLVTIYNHQQLKVVASVHPSQKNDFFIGQKLKIAGMNDEDNAGEIVHISPYVDDKGFFQIEALIKENQKNYIDGEYTELLVETLADKDQLLIPTKAITENDEKAFIYVIKDSKAIYKEVEILQMQAEWTSMKGDIKPGDEVAVKGLILLSDGSNVQVVAKNKSVEKTIHREKNDMDSSMEKDGESN